jgi:hypothetical protein
MSSSVYIERASPAEMEQAKQLERSFSWEAFLQCCKLAFGAILVTILVLINSDIHRLVDCLITNPIDHTIVAPPSINCTSLSIGYALRPKIRVDVCDPPMVAIYVNDSILRAYSGLDASALFEWMNRCYRTNYLKACPVFSTVVCPHYIPHSDVGLCYYNNVFSYIVIGGVRFSHRESLDLLTFIIQ